MDPLHTPDPRGGWQRRLAGLAGMATSAGTLALVCLLFWNSSRHAVDAPGYMARMQHCHELPAAGDRRLCIAETFARAVTHEGERHLADAGPR